MTNTITITAQLRTDYGRGASRRLRHSGQVPAIIYGSNQEATAVSLDHNSMYYALKKESFHTSILNIDIDGKPEKVLLRDFQLHPFRQQVLHLDFLRVNEKEEVVMHIPLHFLNEDTAYAVKTQGAHITKLVTEVEIKALPKNIPPFIEVDLKDIKSGQTLTLSDLVLPESVTLTYLVRGEDAPIVNAAGLTEQSADDLDITISAADVPTIAGKATADKE